MRRGAAVLTMVLTIAAHGTRASAREPLRDSQYGLDRINVERAWGFARGAGVAIAIIDTGVDLEHEDLRGRIVTGYDFVDGDDFAQDDNGHGTHVAGIAAADADNGLGVAGAAPGALIMPLRVLDSRGTGVEGDVAAAIDFAIRRSRDLGLRLVVNLSLTDLRIGGGGVTSRQVQDAIRRAWQAGAVIVAAIGNESLPFGEYPAVGPNVIAVGATDAADRRSAFSNQGATVVAPGERIVSTYWDPETPEDHRVYASGSGTSMAAPFVSAVAALLLSAGLPNTTVVERIVRTSDDLGAPGPDRDFGYGRVNAARALGLPDLGGPGLAPAAPGSQQLGSAGPQFEAIVPPATPRVVASASPARPRERPVAAALVAAGGAVAVAWMGLRRRGVPRRGPLWES